MLNDAAISELKSPVECQRFFALSKRVPKDVKRFCGICRQHGMLMQTRGHICSFKDCNCSKCALVRSRRQVMSQQIRLRRAQDKRFQRTNEPTEADLVPLLAPNLQKDSTSNYGNSLPTSPNSNCSVENFATNVLCGNTINVSILDQHQQQQQQQQNIANNVKNMCYFCQKCKNHGILVWKKQHKRQCPFVECECKKCDLIETRRKLDQHIKKRKSTQAGNHLSLKPKTDILSIKERRESLKFEITAGTESVDCESIYGDTPSTSSTAPSFVNSSSRNTTSATPSATPTVGDDSTTVSSPFHFYQFSSFNNNCLNNANGINNNVIDKKNIGFASKANNIAETMPIITPTVSKNLLSNCSTLARPEIIPPDVLASIITPLNTQLFDSNKTIMAAVNQNYNNSLNKLVNTVTTLSSTHPAKHIDCNTFEPLNKTSQNFLNNMFGTFYNFIANEKKEIVDIEKIEQQQLLNLLYLKNTPITKTENNEVRPQTATTIPNTIKFSKLCSNEMAYNNCSSDPILEHLLKNPILHVPNNYQQENLLKSNRELECLLAIRALKKSTPYMF